jgi:SAM-dependent methyltransferase
MLAPWWWRKALVNAVSFRLRERLRMGRGAYAEKGVDVAALASAHPQGARIRELLERYKPAISGGFSERTVLGAVDVLHLIDRATAPLAWHAPGPIRALDVGCDTFFAAPALHAFWSAHGTLESLVGVELDAFQVGSTGHSRADAAAYYVAALAHTRFAAGDVRDFDGPVNAVTMILPFVAPEQHLAWGLPAGLHAPREVLAHVWEILAPGGLLVVANQGELERDLQRALFDALAIPHAEPIAIPDPLLPRKFVRWAWTAVK